MRFNSKQLQDMSNAVRAGALGAIRAAASGHVGIVLGASDIVTAIYANHLRRGMDEFVLSAGHGSAMLYSVLKLAGHDIPDLKTFRKLGGLPGHPECHIDGVSATTGPLGQGVGNAVGIALAMKIKGAGGRGGKDARVYCLCSDGDLMEGVATESIDFADLYKLNNLILLWDDNGISIDGTALVGSNIPTRMRAAGFNVIKINGNNFTEINRAIAVAKKSLRPTFIQCQTIIGRGSSIAGTSAAHGLGVGDTELATLQKKFTNKDGVKLWGHVAKGYKAQAVRPVEYPDTSHILTLLNSPPGRGVCTADRVGYAAVSTRELSGMVLEKILPDMPMLLGGSADLAWNTNTKTKLHTDITPGNFAGNFINYGVREFAMAAIMNGLAVSGFRPFGGTFLVFSDYMRGAIRLAAMSKLPVIYVFTHDSVAVGEDGPTHQPTEQIASLRLVPNLNVFRPCNGAEVAWSWTTALRDTDRPTCIILSRQKFKQIETPSDAGLDKGAYVIYKSKVKRVTNHESRITIIATGAEVPLAVAIAKKFKNARVVSMPSVERFRAQPREYKDKILAGFVVAIEAGATAPWFEFADAVVGIDGFGENGPGADNYQHFGFDADAIANEIRKKVK